MVDQFKQFMRGGLTPDKARNIVEQKLQSGEMSRAQFDQLRQQAENMLSLLRR